MIDFHPCAEPCYRCNAAAWECIGEFTPRKGRPEDVLECAFCGVRIRVDAVPSEAAAKPVASDGTEFRFQFGRFKGLTFAEADAEPNGRRYLEVLRDTNEKLKERITEYLSHAAPSA
jgi:methylphosphotriester-DNA--protein-cysteine methyltransferase